MSKAQYEYLDALIYKLLVLDPDMSLREIQKHLEENGQHVGDFDFLGARRDKVMRRMISRVNRSTKILNATEYNGRVNHAIDVLLKLTTSNATPASVKARAAEALTNISHKRLMTFTLLGVFMSADQDQNKALGEKVFPEETFDVIMDAINNNHFRPRVSAFKYLPESNVIEGKINDKSADAKSQLLVIAGERKFFTTVPLKNDRSFAVPAR